jgi:uncharacterized protein YndB with AHSA1/START domain
MQLRYPRAMDEPITITREVDVDTDATELWSLIADGERWSEWLVDDGAIEVAPGAGGIIVDDDVVRRVHVHSVELHERVVFEWWTEGERSTVELEIVERGDHRSLRVTETFASTLRASTDVGVAWDLRLLVLCLGSAALART